MAKEKSLKLRTIISFWSLYKHSDEKHRITPRKLNTFLRPFGLHISGVGLSDDIRVLREFGVDVRTLKGPQMHSAWIGEHLISDETLRDLVYAVSTNPNLSKQQATGILQQLNPLATIYQEPLLQSFVDHRHDQEPDDSLFFAYLITKESIENKRRILYTVDYPKYNSDTRSIDQLREWETLFTPKYLYKTPRSLYAIGYNNTDHRIEAIDFQKIATIRLSLEYKENKELVEQWTASITLEDHAPKENPTILYKGPATFRCFASNLKALHDLIGEPTVPVEQAYNFRTTYPVAHIDLTTETLGKLASLSAAGGLQIIAPQSLRAAVSDYCKANAETLTTKKFPRRSSNGRE